MCHSLKCSTHFKGSSGTFLRIYGDNFTTNGFVLGHYTCGKIWFNWVKFTIISYWLVIAVTFIEFGCWYDMHKASAVNNDCYYSEHPKLIEYPIFRIW